MPSKSSPGSNVQNRSPWLVQVRSKPQLDKKFSFNQRKSAEAYLCQLADQGLKVKLLQLETSFQLRLRRDGVKTQFITFDTREEAEQARLKMESDLSVKGHGWLVRYLGPTASTNKLPGSDNRYCMPRPRLASDC